MELIEIIPLNGEYEVWKYMPNGTHMVSSHGKIYSLERFARTGHGSHCIRKPRILGLYKNPAGYMVANLSKKDRPRPVHRMVCLAFVKNPDNKPHVNHIDGVKTNNHVLNLEWCTPQENMDHARGMGLFSDEREIVNLDTGATYRSLQSCARAFGRSVGNLHSALNGTQKTWCGYRWKYSQRGLSLIDPQQENSYE